MSLFARISNVWRSRRLAAEIDEELASHLDEAVRDGRDPAEARRAFGSALHHREHSRDIRILPWLDALRADAVFGWRQLMKRKVTSAAAILSLGIAIGACTAAFRLIDAVLLRPLPIANSDRLYVLSRFVPEINGKPFSFDSWAYPDFRLMRDAARGQAELIALSYAERVDLTYRSDAEMEKAHLQYVSGWMFSAFGLHPAAGRLFDEDDDRTPRAHPYAVLSQDYWTSRFARDPNVIGRNVRIGDDLYTITGVLAGPFTGTEPGTVTDIFVPASMHQAFTRDDASWCRTLALVNPGVSLEPLRQKLDAVSHAFEAKRIGKISGVGTGFLAKLLTEVVRIDPAAAGASGLQQDYRRALQALAVLVALVLLIACANVANLLAAQSAARAREMALRVSIGAGRWRLVQLVLVESAWLGALSAAVGACFAWWSTPFVVSRINPPDNPARIVLPADARVLAFGIVLTFAVTLVFGLLPALRASSVRPACALRGGDPHARRRLMSAIVALQVAFCFLVVFVAGLFTVTFDRLSHRPTGFSTARLLAVEAVSRQPRPAYEWDQLADRLRSVAGVERVALAAWALPGGNSWNGVVSINGAPAGEQFVYFLPVAPGWFETMRLPLLEGRDFRDDDANPGAAIVNQTFVRTFLAGHTPIGQFFLRGASRYQIVGVAADAPYRDIHEPTLPVAFFPIHTFAKDGSLQPARRDTFLVRTAAANPLSMASLLRRTISDFRPVFRASNIRTQQEIVEAQTVRERLLAMLAVFFAFVALLLSAVGLYGVLDYAVVQRSREIGIRRAVGARSATVARLVTANVLFMMMIGALAGVALALGSSRYLQTLLYQVSPTEWDVLLLPAATILLAASVAALPAVIRAIRIDPARILRAD